MNQPKNYDMFFSDLKEQYCNGFPPSVHRDDPLSSFKAEAKVTKSGKRKANYGLVLHHLKNNPDRTGAQIHAAVMLASVLSGGTSKDLDVHEVRRRLSDAKARGEAIQTGDTICPIAGVHSVKWRCV